MQVSGLAAVGDQTSEQIDDEVDRAAMAGVLDLGDVLELVIDGLEMARLRSSTTSFCETRRPCMFERRR